MILISSVSTMSFFQGSINTWKCLEMPMQDTMHIRTARNRTPLQLWIEGHLQHSRGPEQDMSLTQARNIKQSVLLPDIDVDVL